MHGMHESSRTAEVDSEAAEAGLKAAGSAGSAAPGDGSALSLQAAREAIDRVEPGFLQQQDRVTGTTSGLDPLP